MDLCLSDHEYRRSVLLIGFGKRGQRHAEVLRRRGTVVLAAVCDPDSDVLARVPAGVTPFASVNEALKHPGLTHVILAVPHDVVSESIAECSAAGLACLVEKPLGRSLAEAREIAKVVREGATQLMVARQKSRTPGFELLGSLISPARHEARYQLVHTLGLGHSAPGWRGFLERAGGGALIDVGYHAMSSVVSLFGPVNEVVAASDLSLTPSDLEDGVAVQLVHGSGAVGQIILSRTLAPPSECTTVWTRSGRYRLWGDGKVLHVDSRGGETLLSDAMDSSEMVDAQHAAFFSASPIDDIEIDVQTMAAIDRIYDSLRKGGARAVFSRVGVEGS